VKLPYPKNPIINSKYNITYGECLKMTDEEFRDWVYELRDELLKIWDDEEIPPSVGKDEKDIVEDWKKLTDYDVEKFWVEDENYPEYLGFIKNFSKLGSSVNQFFPAMLKTRISGKSMYDYFSNDNLKIDFLRTMVHCFKENNIHYDNPKTKIFPKLFQIFKLGLGQPVVNFNPLTARFLIEKYLSNERLDDTRSPHVSHKSSKMISEFLVFDPCAGWGGRLLGALCSKLPIRYIGIDPNPENYKNNFYHGKYDRIGVGSYECLGRFYVDKTSTKDIRLCRYFENHDSNLDYNFYIKKDTPDGMFVHKRWMAVSVQIDRLNDRPVLGSIDFILTSPPYFDRGLYDNRRPLLKIKNYEDWRKKFLWSIVGNCNSVLKKNRIMVIHFSDIKPGENELEQDTITMCIKQGFDYVGKIGMVMSKIIGFNADAVKNSWFDKNTKTDYKIEPILVFKKIKESYETQKYTYSER
tara:strand:+ start:103 stop:1503 length:1401 start_codon:yes stop_codon:yes gene_type:complete